MPKHRYRNGFKKERTGLLLIAANSVFWLRAIFAAERVDELVEVGVRAQIRKADHFLCRFVISVSIEHQLNVPYDTSAFVFATERGWHDQRRVLHLWLTKHIVLGLQ